MKKQFKKLILNHMQNDKMNYKIIKKLNPLLYSYVQMFIVLAMNKQNNHNRTKRPTIFKFEFKLGVFFLSFDCFMFENTVKIISLIEVDN